MPGIIAALPLLFEGISLVGSLFDEGKKVYEAVAGAPSAAASPAELRAEVEALPEDQQQRFTEAMAAKVEAYKAETERLAVQGGRVDRETLEILPDKTRAEIAYLRMATRPRIAMMMARVIMLPVYVIFVDGALALYNIVSRLWGGAQLTYLVDIFFANAGYVTLYTWAAPTAASVIATYMTLREVGKARGEGDGPSAAALAGKLAGLIGKIRK